MRFPRVRFTLSNLLFAVAVVAANAGAVRLIYDAIEDLKGAIWPTAIIALIGSFPLFNIALIGSMLFTTGRLRAFRRGCMPEPRSSPAGATFFSLHVLAIGAVVTIITPDAVDSYLQEIFSVWEYAEKGCLAVLGFDDDALNCAAVEYLVFAFFVYVPQLLLAWLGHKLANYCAFTLTPWRFRLITGLVSAGFTCVALAIAITPRPFADEQDVHLDLQINDKDSGRPVDGASVHISDPFDQESLPSTAVADAGGRVRLTGRFEIFGERSTFQQIGVFSSWGRWVEIVANGYQTVRIPLPELLGPLVVLDRRRVGKVALTRGETDEASFSDVAGTYGAESIEYLGIGLFRISADGRFAWNPPGFKSPHTDPFDHRNEYGFLKRCEGGIQFVAVPHPGAETHARMKFTYRTVKWGDRLFLTTTDEHQLQRFCRAALLANFLKNYSPPVGVYAREEDSGKAVAGFPRLPPRVWVRFLLGEFYRARFACVDAISELIMFVTARLQDDRSPAK